MQCISRRSVKVKSLSRSGAGYQAPPSMGFSRQEYWSGVPLPSPHEGEKKNKKVTQSSDLAFQLI